MFTRFVPPQTAEDLPGTVAKLKSRSEVQVLVDAIRSQDELEGKQDESVVFDLIRLLTGRPAPELTSAPSTMSKPIVRVCLPNSTENTPDQSNRVPR